MKRFLLCLFFLLGTVFTAPSGYAAPDFTFDDIDYWVGQGSNQAALVIDWHDSRMEETLVWGFRWDGAATGQDMVSAIAGSADVRSSNNGTLLGTTAGADTRLHAQFTSWGGFGGAYTVFGFGYDLDNDGGFTYVNGANETGRSADADDLYNEGWFNGFWSYWVEDDNDDIIGNNAALSNWGLSSRPLADGSVDLWGWDQDLDAFFGGGDGIALPDAPFTATPVPVPGALWLLSSGLIGLAGLRRRQ